MIKGFIVKALTELGETEIKRNSKLDLRAMALFKKRVLDTNPYKVRFLFRQKIICLLNFQQTTAKDLEKSLVKEMKCKRNKDYTLRLI